ncbi:hypothetical protein HMPREF1550_00920 [Actinomyces sp. oral taxon 877 str. F0543]|nr:hypothetical protein HMPREF1550_00920 [Actinomyces sp. oral taxon 877 str. F0543]
MFSSVFPARAGMSPGASESPTPTPCFPRTRGDEPVYVTIEHTDGTFSPHARG